MKRLINLFILQILTFVSFSQTRTTSGDAIRKEITPKFVNGVIKQLTIAQLKAQVIANGDSTTLYYVTDTGRKGYFELDKNDNSSVGNDSTIIVTNNGKRLKRTIEQYLSPSTTGKYYRGDKTWQVITKSDIPTLSNVDNTSDLNKPISTATQTALLGKLDKGYSISELRGLSNSVLAATQMFYCSETGKEGFWKYDASDNSSIDNLGTILVTSGGKRIKRIINNRCVYPEWFGAVGDGISNDYSPISSMFSLGSNINYIFNKSKQYLILNVSDYITISNLSNIKILDLNLKSDNSITNKGGIQLSNCTNVSIKNVNITYKNTPSIRDAKYGIYFTLCSNIIAEGIYSEKSSGAGILFNLCDNIHLRDIKVTNTLADGLHFSNCSGVDLIGYYSKNTGDDGLAFVNYSSIQDKNGANASNISVKNSKARGISVVGASNVFVSNFSVDSTSGPGIYVAYEPAYETRIPDNIVFSDGLIAWAGTYLTGVGNRFGANYSQCINVGIRNVRIIGSYTRGVSGVGSNAVIKLDNISVENTFLGDDYNLSGKEVYANNCISKEAPGYGIIIQNVGLIAKINASTVINSSKASALNRAIWFEGCNSFFCLNSNIIDNQTASTGRIIGEYANTFGQFQSNVFNISNGSGGSISASSANVRIVKTIILEGIATLSSGSVTINNPQITTNSKVYIQTKSVSGVNPTGYSFSTTSGSATITARNTTGGTETGCNNQVTYQILDN